MRHFVEIQGRRSSSLPHRIYIIIFVVEREDVLLPPEIGAVGTRIRFRAHHRRQDLEESTPDYTIYTGPK
jgi:hypothetical protein